MEAQEIVRRIHDILDGKTADDPYTGDASKLRKIADLVGATFDDSIPTKEN